MGLDWGAFVLPFDVMGITTSRYVRKTMSKVRKSDVYYRYNLPAEVTVQIDSREQYPLLFPEMVKIAHPERSYLMLPIQVLTQKTKLDCGDYMLKEYPKDCIIERKASQLEIFKNLEDHLDRIRQAKAFRRLSGACKHPTLMIEASAAELLSVSPRIKNPEVVAHRLSLAIARYNFNVIFAPWKSRSSAVRRKVGTLLVHLMLGYALQSAFDVPPVLLEDESAEG